MGRGFIFGLGISKKGCLSHNFTEFPGVKACFLGISRGGKVTNLKFLVGVFRKLCKLI